MKRAVILSLKFVTAAKRVKLEALLSAYREAVNFYIGVLWVGAGKFDSATTRLLTISPLSYRYKTQALKQADGIVRGEKTRAGNANRPPCHPAFAGGMDLSTNFLNLSFSNKHFDCWARLSVLERGKPLWLPLRKTRMFVKWAARGRLIAGGTLFTRRGVFYIRVSFEIADVLAKNGIDLGVDRGVKNVIATSDGVRIGTGLDRYIDRIKRTVPKSRGRIRALRARDQYVHHCLKQLPWGALGTLVVENLKGIKTGKRGKLRRATNRRFSHWTIGRMSTRLQQLCEENRVLLATVDAAYTSQTCPACGHAEKANRRDQAFRCVRCDHSDHADVVGARNVLARWSGMISVPRAKKS